MQYDLEKKTSAKQHLTIFIGQLHYVWFYTRTDAGRGDSDICIMLNQETFSASITNIDNEKFQRNILYYT